MQVQVKEIEEKKEKVFHPFILEFKIESEQDLLDMYLRFTLQPHSINKHLENGSFYHSSNTYLCTWTLLDNLLEEKPYMK